MKVFLSILACSTVLFAGNYDESYALLDNILKLGAASYEVCKAKDMEIVKIDIDLVGKNNSKQVLKRMSPDFKYAVFCIGDPERIKDIDIKVHYLSTGSAIQIVKDESTDPTASVVLENPTPGDYIIEVNAYEMQPGHTIGYFYLCIAHN